MFLCKKRFYMFYLSPRAWSWWRLGMAIRLWQCTFKIILKIEMVNTSFQPLSDGCYQHLYLFELFKILSIQFIFDLRNKCSLHSIQLVPLNAFKPRMILKLTEEQLQNTSKKFLSPQVNLPKKTFISLAPFVPRRWSTLHRSLLVRSLASGDNLASSGNFKCDLQFTICIVKSKTIFTNKFFK